MGKSWHSLLATPSFRQRPYCGENTGSLPNSEVKHRKARIVLGWVTAREVLRVLLAFSFIYLFYINVCIFKFRSLWLLHYINVSNSIYINALSRTSTATRQYINVAHLWILHIYCINVAIIQFWVPSHEFVVHNSPAPQTSIPSPLYNVFYPTNQHCTGGGGKWSNNILLNANLTLNKLALLLNASFFKIGSAGSRLSVK